MKLFNVNFATLILRFYLLMGIVIVAFFIGYSWLAMLSLPVFFISLMGVSFKRNKAAATSTSSDTQLSHTKLSKGFHQPAH